MTNKGGSGGKRYSPVRPQIMVGLIVATIFSCFGIWVGMEMAAVEIVTAIVGGYLGYLAGISSKLLEQE